jgi:hypothetical protein
MAFSVQPRRAFRVRLEIPLLFIVLTLVGIGLLVILS